MVRFLSFYHKRCVYVPSIRHFPALGSPPLPANHMTPYFASSRTSTTSVRIVSSSHSGEQTVTPPEYLSFPSSSAINDIVEEDVGVGYPNNLSPFGVSDMPYLGLREERDEGSPTGSNNGPGAASSTVCDDGDNEAMGFGKAKARLAYYVSLLGNRGVKPSSLCDPCLRADELSEVRSLLDCLIQSDHPHKSHCVLDALRVAYHFGFAKRCCELYAGVAQEALRGGAGQRREHWAPLSEGALLPDVVLAAAARTMDEETLGLCTSVVERMASREGAGPREAFKVAPPAAVPALRLYWCLVQLLRDRPFSAATDPPAGFAGGEEGMCGILTPPQGSLWERSNAPLAGLAVRAAAVLGVAEEARAAFLNASVRLARYNKDNINGQAAVYYHVFRYWRPGLTNAHEGERGIRGDCIASEKEKASPLWLMPHCLHELMRSAIYARRRDIAEVYSLYADLFWLHRVRPSVAQLASSEDENLEKPLDPYEDALVGSMVRYFLFSRQTRRAVCWIQRLVNQLVGYVPSIQVCNAIARAAAAERDVVLSRWCLGHLLNEKQPIPPTSTELYSCLCSNARVGIPNFGQVLHSLQENQLVQLTGEELFHLQLLHCRGSTQWQDISKIVLQATASGGDINKGGNGSDSAPGPTEASPTGDAYETLSIASVLGGRFEHLETNPRTVFSIRNLDLLLLVLQESEHPNFLDYYRFFLSRYRSLLKLEKQAHWAGLALVWASTRVNKMQEGDILYIAWEVAQLLQSQQTGDPKDAPVSNEPLDGILPNTEKSLRRKWEMVCAHFPKAWWRRQLGKKIRQQKHQLRRNLHQHGVSSKRGADAVLIDEAVLESIICASESSTLPFARFLKHHTRGLCTSLTSTGLFDGVTLAILRTEGPCDEMGRDSYYSLATKREWWRFYQSN